MNKVSISILDCDFDNIEFEINRINNQMQKVNHQIQTVNLTLRNSTVGFPLHKHISFFRTLGLEDLYTNIHFIDERKFEINFDP